MTDPRHGRVGLAVTGDGRRDTPAIVRHTRSAATGGSLRLDAPRSSPPPPDRARGASALAVALLAIVALVAVGCSVVVDPTPPSPTPADFGGIAAALVQAGIKVVHPVAGDAGCQDRVLVPTAISFEATGLDQPTPVKIYMYVFADRATFERLRTTVDSVRAQLRDRSRDVRVGRAVAVRHRRPGTLGTAVQGRAPERAGSCGRDGRLGRAHRSLRRRAGRGSGARSRAAGPGWSPPRSRSASRRAGSARPGTR